MATRVNIPSLKTASIKSFIEVDSNSLKKSGHAINRSLHSSYSLARAQVK